MPESSETAGRPSAAATARAFNEAFSRYVAPVSSTSGNAAGSVFETVTHVTGQSPQIRASSRSLWWFRVAIAIRSGRVIRTSAGEGVALDLRERGDAVAGQVQDGIELAARERLPLGRPLHLDERAGAGHDDVEVH